MSSWKVRSTCPQEEAARADQRSGLGTAISGRASGLSARAISRSAVRTFSHICHARVL